MFSARPLTSASLVLRKVLVCILLFLQGATALRAREVQAGLAWHVQGTWRVEGVAKPIRSGDAIEPASLLQPDEAAGPHSVTILLPDGQRVLYECFTAADCARGFRVPSLIRKPDPFALDMLARIGSILLRDSARCFKRAAHQPFTSTSAPAGRGRARCRQSSACRRSYRRPSQRSLHLRSSSTESRVAATARRRNRKDRAVDQVQPACPWPLRHRHHRRAEHAAHRSLPRRDPTFRIRTLPVLPSCQRDDGGME